MDNDALEIYYIRHADAENGLTDGRDICDKDLTLLGEKQLELLYKRFEGAKIDAVLSSPLVRTVKTAAAVASAADGNLQIEIVPELIEKGSTPGYYGLSINELKKYYNNLILCKDKIHSLPIDGDETESKEECIARARDVVDYIKNRFNYGKKIVIVSHGTFAINFNQAAMGIFDEYNFRFTTYNTAVTKIKFQSDGVKRISFQNDVSHLIPLIPNYQFEM